MANDKTYDRHVNIWINGKEVKNSLSDIKKEMYNLANETNRAIKGSDEYNQKAAELRKVKQIYKEHQADINGTGGAWNKLKGLFSSAQGVIMAGIGGIMLGYKSLKSVIFSTDALGDRFEKTLKGWRGGFDALARSLATINEGGLKDLGKKIREGIDEGRRYAESLDAIDEKTRALQIAEAEANNELLRQTEIAKSALYSKEQQIAAGKKVIEIEEKLTTIRTGIANQAFENEAKNIAKATKLTNEEVLAFARQDAAMVTNIENGKDYNEMLAEFNTMETAKTLGMGRPTKEYEDRYKFLKENIAAATEETKRFAFAQLNMPGDEKMQLFTDKYVAYQQAIGSGLENTMKIRTSVAKKEDQLNDEAIKGATKVAKTKEELELESFRQTMQINADVQEVIDTTNEKYFDAIDAKKKKDDKYAKAHHEQEVIAEREAQDFIDLTLKDWEDADEKLYAAKREVLNSAFQFESTLFDAQFAKLDSKYKKDIAAAGDNADAKARIDADYNKKRNALMRKAAIAEKLTALFSIGLDTAKGAANAASKIVTLPLVPWIIANGVIQAAIVAARPIPQFWDGGFTGSGGKHEAAGIVHKGEYVVNADMVASPVFGPIVEAMESARVNGMNSYSNGGGPGFTSSGSGAAVPSSVLIGTDPALKQTLNDIRGLLAYLKRDGVKNSWPWQDIDNMRKGMTKLGDVESSVSM